MIKNTPNMSDKDLDFWEMQMKTMEKAMGTMMKKKLVDFPASALAAIWNPIKSGFKLPGEVDASVETPVATQSSSQTEGTEETSGIADGSAQDTDTPMDKSADSSEDLATSSRASCRSLPVEKRQYSTKEEAYLHSDRRELAIKDKVAYLHQPQGARSELSTPTYFPTDYHKRVNTAFRERQRQRFAGSQARVHGRNLLDNSYQNTTQSANSSTSAPVPDIPEDVEAKDRAFSLIGHFQNELRYLELANTPWEEQIDHLKNTTMQLSGIDGIPADLVVEIGEYFRDISRYIAPSSKDLHETMTKIEGRSTPLSKPIASPDDFHQIMPWGTLNKRDTDVHDESPEYVNITTTPTVSTVEGEQERFWIDFGAPECMKFILDEDLDQAKLAMFDTCQENASPETPDASEITGPPEISEGKIEERDIEKHMYEIEEDGDEWGRKTLIKGGEDGSW